MLEALANEFLNACFFALYFVIEFKAYVLLIIKSRYLVVFK